MDKKDKRIQIMDKASPGRAILTMSIPVILGMMVNIVYNLVDTWFIGLLGNEFQLAASNLAMPVFIFIMAVASLIGMGGSSYLSRSLGAGKKQEAEKVLSIAFFLILVFGILMAVFGLVFYEEIPILLGASQLNFKYTLEYVSILIFGAIFIIGNFAFSQLIRAEGSAKLSMIGMMLGAIANIILDPIFIFTLNWGVAGAAFATIIGNFLSFLFFIGCYYYKKTYLSLDLFKFIFDLSIFREIFLIGTPIMIGKILISVAQMVQNNLAAFYGDILVASLGISLRLMTLGTFIFIGFSAGSQPLMGYSYGSGNYQRFRKLIKVGIIMTTSIGFLILLIIYTLAPALIYFFTPLTEIKNNGIIILRILAFSLPLMGGITLITSAFQAMGNPFRSFILNISRQGLIFIPLLFILNNNFGWRGMVYAQPITDFIMSFLAFSLLFITMKKLNSEGRKNGDYKNA